MDSVAIRQRLCRFCRQPIPAELPGQSRYCCRSHRQRAYEARQAADVTQLRRRLRTLERRLAAYEACIDRLSDHPTHGHAVATAFLEAVAPRRRPGG
jgi:hypothetical protein